MDTTDPTTDPVPYDIHAGQIDADLLAIERSLAAIGDQLSAMWAGALAAGDFRRIDRLVEASHAVHRASSALAADLGSPSAPPERIDLDADPGPQT